LARKSVGDLFEQRDAAFSLQLFTSVCNTPPRAKIANAVSVGLFA